MGLMIKSGWRQDEVILDDFLVILDDICVILDYFCIILDDFLVMSWSYQGHFKVLFDNLDGQTDGQTHKWTAKACYSQA